LINTAIYSHYNFKNIIIFILIMKAFKLLLAIIPFALVSCSKGGDTSTPTPTPTPTQTEAAVAFSVNVDPGSGNILGVVGTSQAITVKVSSALPSAGVTVGVTVTKDADNSTVFSTSNSSVSTDNNVTITGLAPGVLCTANVVVTSKSTLTNTKGLTFKLAAK
jgi:hypothetical protein